MVARLIAQWRRNNSVISISAISEPFLNVFVLVRSVDGVSHPSVLPNFPTGPVEEVRSVGIALEIGGIQYEYRHDSRWFQIFRLTCSAAS